MPTPKCAPVEVDVLRLRGNLGANARIGAYKIMRVWNGGNRVFMDGPEWAKTQLGPTIDGRKTGSSLAYRLRGRSRRLVGAPRPQVPQDS